MISSLNQIEIESFDVGSEENVHFMPRKILDDLKPKILANIITDLKERNRSVVCLKALPGLDLKSLNKKLFVRE